MIFGKSAGKISMNILAEKYSIGEMELNNRIVMAPLTRRRYPESGIPSEINGIYYLQRASAGLIIAEATNISAYKGYPNTPGIYTAEQAEGWKNITEAVHQAGGKIFIQLWHTGRYSHPDLLPEGQWPVSASPLIFDGKINTPAGYRPLEVPKELSTDEIRLIISDFTNAAKNALLSGFDGIEIHAANGYLINQFLCDNTNIRKDEYGGSVEKRFRFLAEILESTIRIFGKNRVGVRLSPCGIKNGMADSNPALHFSQIISMLNDFQLAYLHLIEPLLPVDHLQNYPLKVAEYFRPFYHGTLIANGNIHPFDAENVIKNKMADLIAFGKYFISNPDLPYRIFNRLELQPWDESTFYTSGEKGYIDYPLIKE